MKKTSFYPGFEYPSDQLSKFLNAGELFTIRLINNEIIHHEVDEPLLFRQWLLDNGVENIKKVAIPSMS
jgi:hypothetical protein